MTVSACLIVRDEEAFLARALDCFKDLVDEIVIVDTGSVDRTKAIAMGYTDKVYDFAWQDDFSAARNFAFSKCTMAYVYTADADEIIDEANRAKLRTLIQTLPETVDIVQMHYTNQIENGTIYNFDSDIRPKLFRRLRQFHWIHPIHEMVEVRLHVVESDVAIIHKPDSNHSKRDFAIFEHFAKPGAVLSERLHELYARELFVSGDREDFLKAFAYFEGCLHVESIAPDTIKQSECVVVRCHYYLGNSSGLLKVALKNMLGKPSAEVCCDLGSYYFGLQDYKEAASWYEKAAFGANIELYARAGGDMPLLRLAECCQLLGRKVAAKKYLIQARAWHPESLRVDSGAHRRRTDRLT